MSSHTKSFKLNKNIGKYVCCVKMIVCRLEIKHITRDWTSEKKDHGF